MKVSFLNKWTWTEVPNITYSTLLVLHLHLILQIALKSWPKKQKLMYCYIITQRTLVLPQTIPHLYPSFKGHYWIIDTWDAKCWHRKKCFKAQQTNATHSISRWPQLMGYGKNEQVSKKRPNIWQDELY